MKKSLLFLVSLAFCLSLSAKALAQKSSSCGPDATNLRVTLYGKPSELSNANAYRILSDKFDATTGDPIPYQSQKLKGDTIDAKFQIDNCSQDFTMNLYYSKRIMKVYLPNYTALNSSTFFNFDRVASVPVTPVDAAGCDPNIPGSCAATDWVRTSQFCTATPQPISGFVVGKNPDGTYRDNYAGCAVDADGRAYVRRNVGMNLPDNYRLRFQNSPIDGSSELADGTSYIRVYHYAADSVNRERWELVPDNDVYNNSVGIVTPNYGPLGAILYFPNQGSPSRVDSQFVPFKIKVEKLQ